MRMLEKPPVWFDRVNYAKLITCTTQKATLCVTWNYFDFALTSSFLWASIPRCWVGLHINYHGLFNVTLSPSHMHIFNFDRNFPVCLISLSGSGQHAWIARVAWINRGSWIDRTCVSTVEVNLEILGKRTVLILDQKPLFETSNLVVSFR
jgi:hypothetical protein